MEFNKKENGFIAVLITFLVLLAMLASAVSLSTFIIGQHKIASNFTKSTQAYYAAESGIEDAVYRIRKGLNVPATYNFQIGGAQSNIQVADPIGGTRVITSRGVLAGNTRSLEAVNALSGDNIQFFFGAQVGEGGLIMSNGSKIDGNIFSNSSVIGSPGAIITGSAEIAGDSSKIEKVNVGGSVRVKNCKDSNIGGELSYVTGGSVINCSAAGGVEILPDEIPAQPLPISVAQINDWKAQAQAGGVFVGNYSMANNATASLGPIKIQGNLIFSNNNVLTLKGTIWVSGNIQTGNNTTIKLDNSVYGPRSGVVIADGIVDISNNSVVQGTGQAGSYLMILTTNPADPAMNISNNSLTGIFYASNGYITMANNAQIKEVTAYGLHLSNNVLVKYETGLSSLYFTSGPGSGWKISSWREIE